MKRLLFGVSLILVLGGTAARLGVRWREEAADRRVTLLVDWAEVRDWVARQGMTDEAVVKFVDLYYPAYELYLPRLHEQGFFAAGKAEEGAARQLMITQDIGRAMVRSRTMS